MHEAHISSICITDDGELKGIVTLRDMNGRVVAKGADTDGPISAVMTATRLTLGPKALVTDVLHLMVERGIGHVPIVDGSKLLGIVTQTDLTRALAMSSADLVGRVAKARRCRRHGAGNSGNTTSAGSVGRSRQPTRGHHAPDH